MSKFTWGGKRSGAGRPRGSRGKGQQWKIEEAKQLINSGLKLRVVAIRLGTTYNALWEALKKEGLTKRRSPKPQEDHNWNIILEQGSITTRETSEDKRRYISFDGKLFIYARVLWNAHNPHDLVGSHEIVHHKDENSLNDFIENYEKVTRQEHRRLHSPYRKAWQINLF